MSSCKGIDYSRGKIYKIQNTETGKVYVGHTTKQYLSQRLNEHRTRCRAWQTDDKRRYCTSFEVLENNNHQILLLEAFPCSSVEELRVRERYWIDSIECVNKQKPTRTKKEWQHDNKERNKARREERKEEIVQYRKDYREANREQISDKMKKWYRANKERIKEQKRGYRENNKEQIKARNSIQINCPCGGHYRRDTKARHTRSVKHQSWENVQDVSKTIV